MYAVGSGSQFDDRRNTSAVRRAPPGSVEAALQALAAWRRSDPEAAKWVADGHPNLTEDEFYARFGRMP